MTVTNTANLTAARLKGDFDVRRLRAELAVLERTQWSAQRDYGKGPAPVEGTAHDWKVLSLRSPGGVADRTDPGGFELVEYEGTPWLEEVPYIKSVLDSLPTFLKAVRLMSLGPGGRVKEHRDQPYGLAAGWVRLHIPFITNKDAVCTLDGEPHTWQPGAFWFGDFSRPHSVHNGGTERRVHLVIDAYVTLELLELFSAEFRGRIRLADVLLHRPALPLTEQELAGFQCTFTLPDAFLHRAGSDILLKAAGPDRAARLRVADGRLVLDVDGKPRVGLVHLGEGEFRILGWTAERTLKVEPVDRGLRIRFRMRHGSRLEEVAREGVPAAMLAYAETSDTAEHP
jgi:aspartate beta-hydroxylase